MRKKLKSYGTEVFGEEMIEANSIKPLQKKNSLAATPAGQLKYQVKVNNLSGEEIILGDPKMSRVLIALMNQHAVTGGAAAHWGGPAAFAEMISAIHGLMFQDKEIPWYEKYNFVNDAGHAENGIYAIRANYGFDGLTVADLMHFRSFASKLTGHGEAHVNPQGVFVSNGPLGSGVPQAQGLAFADKLIGNDRCTICVVSDGAAMEGEAKESFASIPGLAAKEKMNPFVMVLSDNDTKLSGRISDDSFDLQPTFESLKTLGWNVIKEEDGNDIQKVFLSIERGIEEAKKDPSKPVCVHLKTVKGFGLEMTSERKDGGHGYPVKPYDSKFIEILSEIYGEELPQEIKDIANKILLKKEDKSKAGEAIPATEETKKEKVQVGIAAALNKAASEGLPVFSVTSDLPGSTGIKGFHSAFPDRCLDLGVAEANMIGAAVGIAKQGFIPIVDTFAQFGITKGNLPIIMASLSEGPIIGVFSHTGFQDAADGASHQATTYISALAAIPNVQLIQCATSSEAEFYVYQAIKQYEEKVQNGETPPTTIFFVGRENALKFMTKDQKFEWGKALVLREGDAATVVAAGPMVTKAIAAYELLKKEGINITVINNPFVNKVDVDTFREALDKTKGKLVTVEDHQVLGGMGAILSHELLQSGLDFKVKSLGIDGRFGRSAYKADQLYDSCSLSPEGIANAVRELIGK